MKNLWLKWAILVWLNTIVGWYFGADNQWGNIPYIVGIAMGVCLFIPLYVTIEKNAERKNQPHLKKAITIGVIIRALLQGVVVVDMWSGLLAGIILNTVSEGLFSTPVMGTDAGFFSGFFMTVMTGLILSGVVAVLTVIIMGVLSVFDNQSHVKQG